MKKIDLDNIIREQLKDEEFSIYYQKELVINAIATILVAMQKNKKTDRM